MSSAFKFDQYGCHCFQRGLESSAFTGKGPALDNMDRACLKFHQCQRCLGIDKGKVRSYHLTVLLSAVRWALIEQNFKECNHLSTYDIRLVEDSVTSKRSAVCQDEPGSCGRNLCECTVAFAKAMKEAEETRYVRWVALERSFANGTFKPMEYWNIKILIRSNISSSVSGTWCVWSCPSRESWGSNDHSTNNYIDSRDNNHWNDDRNESDQCTSTIYGHAKRPIKIWHGTWQRWVKCS